MVVAPGAVRGRLPEAVMWTVHGRTFPAPAWEFGYPSAASLYAPVTDLGKFAQCLFRGGPPVLRTSRRTSLLRPMFSENLSPII